MKSHSSQLIEHPPLQQRRLQKVYHHTNQKNNSRSGTAMSNSNSDYRASESMTKFQQASHDESLPLRRRPLPLPPSAMPSHATTNSSNALLNSQFALQYSSTSSLPAHMKTKTNKAKKLTHKRGSMQSCNSQSAHLTGPSSTRQLATKGSSQSLAKENANFANIMHAQKNVGAASYRSEQNQAAPSSAPQKGSYPKVQSAKRQKQWAKKEKDKVISQERKLHVLQLQFMQQTLSRLQQEKLSRAEALNRAISRKNNRSQLAGRSRSDFSLTSGSQMTEKKGAVPSEGRRSKSRLHESFLSQSSRLSRSMRNSRSRSRNNSTDSHLMQRTSSQLRSKPRLCELKKFQDSVMNQSELMPFRASTRNEGGPPKVNSSKSSRSGRPQKRPSSHSSSERTQKKHKLAKKSSKQLPRGDTSSWKRLSTKVSDDQLKKRQAKIRLMEEQFLQAQIERAPQLQLNDISVIPSQNTTQPYPGMLQYAGATAQGDYSTEMVSADQIFGRIESHIAAQPDIFAIPEKFSTTGPSEQEEDTEVGEDGEGEVYIAADQNLEEPELQSEDTFAHRSSKYGQTEQYSRYQSERVHQFYQQNPSMVNMPLQMNNFISARPEQHHSHQVLPQQQQQRSATDEKLPLYQSSSQGLMSQVTIPQIGGSTQQQVASCFEMQSSMHEVHPHGMILQSSQSQQREDSIAVLDRVQSHQVFSLDGASTQQQSFANKHQTTNKDQRRLEDSSSFREQTSSQKQIINLPKKIETQPATAVAAGESEEMAQQRNKLVNFFESEYRNAQKDLIASKSELYEQKYKAEMLKKRVTDYEQLIERMNAEMVKLQEENRHLKNEMDVQSKTWRTSQDNHHQPLQVPLSQRSGSLCNKELTTQRTHSCLQSELKPESVINGGASQEMQKIREENAQLQQQNSELVHQLQGLSTAQKSQDVLIQYLQGTQNSILQKMQHQMIKNMFTSNLVETAQLATNFMSGDKEQAHHLRSAGDFGEEQAKLLQYQSTPQQMLPNSLDLQQFIALKKEDIGTSVDEYFRRTNEAAGLSSEKKEATEPLQGSNSLVNRGKSTSVRDQSKSQKDESDLGAQSELPERNIEQPRQENCYFGSGLILPEDCQDFSRVISQAEDVPQLNREVQSQAQGGLSQQESTNHSILNDYDSKNYSEHRQNQLKQRLSGISPVTNIRKTDSRRSLSYQKSNNSHQNQNQQSSNKGQGAAANNDVSLISLSQVNSNSKYMFPKQMRQLLRKHSSEDGEIEDYLQTGAFEKRSNEMRLFSLDGTAQQDIQNMIELSQSNVAEDLGEVHKALSPVKDFIEDANGSQSNVMLNLNQLQNMQEPLSKVNQVQANYPEALDRMRHKLVFSGGLQESAEERVEEEAENESQLSSPEMNCTQTDSKITTNNNASMKTKEQREIQAIIATTKQHSNSHQNSAGNLYSVDQITQAANNLQLSDCEFPKTSERSPNMIKSPQFNQALNLPLYAKGSSLQIVGVGGALPDGNASQEMYSKTQNSMNIHTAASARPHSTCKVSSEMIMTKNEASDERSNTTVSASFLHNIHKSNVMARHRKNNPSMTSHDTVPVDYFLQRENTQGSSCNFSGLQHPMASGTLTHMPTEQCIPRLTSSFQQQLKTGPHTKMNMNAVNMSQVSAQNSHYSPFKTHQPGQIHNNMASGAYLHRHDHHQSSSRRPLHLSQSRSTSPNPTCNGSSSVQHDYCSQSNQGGNGAMGGVNQSVAAGKDLASSSERIQKRTKKMKQEISEIDRDIAMLHNVISQ